MKKVWGIVGVFMAIIMSASSIGTQVYAASISTEHSTALIGDGVALESSAAETEVSEDDYDLQDISSDSISEEAAGDMSSLELSTDEEAYEMGHSLDDGFEENSTDEISDSALLCSDDVAEEVVVESKMVGNIMTSKELNLYSIGSTVSRIEWLKTLIREYNLSIEEDNYPDNYYSDVDASNPDYHSIMIATDYGFVDVDPGEPMNPDGIATREFVAHTLNMMLGFVVDDAYSFPENSAVLYQKDIEASIRYGIFELINGDFLPDRGVTSAEVSHILDIIREISEKKQISGEQTYKFNSDVILLPKDTDIITEDQGLLRIKDFSGELSEGKIFGIVYEGMPLAWKATKVYKDSSDMMVEIESIDLGDAFEEINYQTEGNVKAEDVKLASATAEISYAVGGTLENGFEDARVFSSLDEVGTQEVSAYIIEDEIHIPSEFDTQSIKNTKEHTIINGLNVKYTVKVTNVKYDLAASLLKGHAHAAVDFDTIVNVEFDGDLAKLLDRNLLLCSIPLIPGVYYEMSLLFNIKGSLKYDDEYHTHLGAYWDGWAKGVRFEKNISLIKPTTVSGELVGTIGYAFNLKADYLIIKAELYAKLGIEAKLQQVTYSDSLNPGRCTNISFWLFALVGYDMSIIGKSVGCDSINMFNYTNSPVKVSIHYEDGVQVGACTNPDRFRSGHSENIYPGYRGLKRGYNSPLNTKNYYNGHSGTIGTGDNSVVIFLYSKDEEEKTATITAYKGNMVDVHIPEILDGYTVVGIAGSAFKKNTNIRSVTIPDSVKSIGGQAFYGCEKLKYVTLSNSLETIGYSAFGDCDSIEEIKIPKSLDTTTIWNYTPDSSYNGVFCKCDNLKYVTFEEGTTKIAYELFANCPGLESITIPKSVTSIENYSFSKCTNLKNVTFPESLSSIGSYAFYGCQSLNAVNFPDNIKSIGNMSFANCSMLVDIKLPQGIEKLGYSAFGNCDSVNSIVIPRSLDTTEIYNYSPDATNNGPFCDCDGLKNISFEEGTSKIAYELFANCSGIETIDIPNTVTKIESRAFINCVNLKNITLSGSLTEIGNRAFYNCSSIEKLVIPDSVNVIDAQAFGNCRLLQDVLLSNNLDTLGYGAFYNCDNIKKVKIPKSIIKTTIWNYTPGSRDNGPFNGCDSLKIISFEEGISAIPELLFANCPGIETVVIPETVISIGTRAFYYCENLKSITLSEGLKEISACAFEGDSKLENLDIPDSVLSIGNNLFENCISLKKVSLPASRKNIMTGMFKGCISLEMIEFPQTVTTVQEEAFYGCTSLKKIVLTNRVQSIEKRAFYKCTALEKVEINSEVPLTIAANTFQDCSGLVTVEMSDYVISLGKYSFAGCTKLKNVKLSTGITAIPDYCFSDCGELDSITLPYNTKSIGKYAFLNDSSLMDIYIPRATENIDTTAFSYKKLKIHGVDNSYAKTYAEKNGYIFVIENVPAQKVEFLQDSYTMNTNSSLRLVYKITPSNFTDSVTWVFDTYYSNFISVKDGVVTSHSKTTLPNDPIEVYIFVGDEVYASCKINIVQAITSINLSKTDITMDAGSTYKLTATISPSTASNKEIEWSSSDESVATVDNTGVVTALSKGTATIKAEAKDGSGKHKECRVNVPNTLTYAKSTLEFQSHHPYEKNSSNIWVYKIDGAEKLYVKFSSETMLDKFGYDKIDIKDYNNRLIGTYKKNELSGMELEIEGNTIWLQLTAAGNSVGSNYGFSVEYINAEGSEPSTRTFTVLFNPVGGILSEESPSTITVNQNEKYGPLPTAEKEGYVFTGWYTSPDNGEKVTSESIVMITSNQTLYAHWASMEYTIRFDANGGSVSTESKTVKYGQDYGELPDPSMAGGTFLGWYTEKTDGTKVVSDTPVSITADQTLYAHWSLKYTVADPVFDVQTGTELEKGSKIIVETSTNGANIYYTVDGSDPSVIDNAFLYEDAIIISENTIIKAVAVKAGQSNSGVVSATYTVRDGSNDWGDVLEEDKAGFENADNIPENLWMRGVTDADYTGKAITFADIRVYKGKELLKEGIDYTVKYSNNIKAGNATITVTGKGNYSGTIVKTFKINQLDIGLASAQNITLAFNNKVQKGTTSVTYMLNEVNTTLKANTDFIFVYPRTNSKAADYDAAAFKAAGVYEVQIVGKGNYTGTKTFNLTITQSPLISKMTVKGIASKVTYTGSAITQDKLEVWNGKVKLTEGTDYTVEHKNNTDIGTASVVITGKGVFAGTKTVNFTITGYAFKNAIFGKEVTNSYTYTGSDIRPIDENASLSYKKSKTETVHLKGIEKASYESLNSDSKRNYDYTYEYVGDTLNIGTVKVVYTGINAYTGTVSKNYKIIGTTISKMFVDHITVNNYTGEQIKPEVRVYQKATKTAPEKVFVLGTDYIVSYENNVNAGKKATIIITGINGCTGTIKKTFTISPKDIGSLAVTVDNAVYQKGGSRPSVILRDGTTELVSGADYTVTYSNNTKTHDGIAAKAPTVKIVGKGNYNGTVSRTFAIVSSNMDNVTISASDITYQNKAGICKPTIKLFDSNGKALASGTDYEKTVTYRYSKDVMVSQVVDARKKIYKDVVRVEGTAVDSKDIIPVGAEIIAEIVGKGNYPGKREVTFRFVTADLSKATITVANQYFTGKEIRPTKDDITVKVGKEILKKTDYEIVGYNKNVAKGNAEVIVRGTGNYGGTKTAKFSIVVRSMSYTVVYMKNADDATGSMKNSVTAANAKVSANAYKRRGYKFAGWSFSPGEQAVDIKNSGQLVLSTQNEYGSVIYLYAQWVK